MWRKDDIELINDKFSFSSFLDHCASSREKRRCFVIYFSSSGRQAFLWTDFIKGTNKETDYPPRPDLSGMVFKDSKISAGIGAWTGISQAR